MGWTRKDSCRLYFEVKDKSYIMVITENGFNNTGHYDAIGNVHSGSVPSLASTGCSRQYLKNRCKRVSWDEMPENWQNAFAGWMREWSMNSNDPAKIKGLTRI